MKVENPYSLLVADVQAPVSVWKAVAVALAVENGDADAVSKIMRTWRRLYEAGVVAQKPRRLKSDGR